MKRAENSTGLQQFEKTGMVMVKSINGWVEDDNNPGMFSKVINGEHVSTYVAPNENPRRKLAQVEAQLTNVVLLVVIPFVFFVIALWRRSALRNALRAVTLNFSGRR
jgi:hypothetical protein